MLIHHYVPVASKRIGGLDTAVQGLNRALVHGGESSVVVDVPAWSARHPLPEVAHFHGMWDPRHCRIAGAMRRLGVPTVVSPHGMLEPWALAQRAWKKRPFFRLLEKPRLTGSDAVLATSAMERRHLELLVPEARVSVLPLGLDVPADVATGQFRAAARASLGLSEATPMVLFLSRIDVKKGTDHLLQAWRDLEQRIQSQRAILFVVGGGDDTGFERHCRALAQDCNTAGAAVRWVGPVWGDERWKYFAAADLFCLPSHSENFGFVVPEAWFCGTPVLTTTRTPWGGNEPQEGLRICEPGASPLHEALASWLAGPRTTDVSRDTIAARARAQLSWDSLLHGYLDFYQSLTGQFHTASRQKDQ